MQELNDDINVSANLFCKVCGENNFDLREGFFYCQECGTMQDQVRAIEVDIGDAFTDGKHVKKHKIKAQKVEKPKLTSWECYNYILRGLVEELLSYGAKEDLKLMALQIWAAYLRNSEVAFFNTRHAEMPKLGVRHLKTDAQNLYNHCEVKQKRIRKRRSLSGKMDKNGRAYRKRKRQLDESIYSKHNHSLASNDNSMSDCSINSSSGASNRGIQLKFSSNARKHLKKIMSVKHLAKHEHDAECQLKCHSLKPGTRTMNRREYVVSTLNLQQIYAILALALNLIEDDLQLSDLVRFIREGHVGQKNILQYFPCNISDHSEELLRDIDFFLYPDKCSDKVLREHVGALGQFIHINHLKMPDIYKLALRYIADLNLPKDIAKFLERLINLLPPQMQTRVAYHYPAFEARAMAYIIFVLKLLFGLDGHKERVISDSAKQINKKIQQFKKMNNKDKMKQQKLLFVWDEWVEYVQMRKVMVSQYSSNFCRQYKQSNRTTQLQKDLHEDRQRQLTDQEETITTFRVKEPNSKISSMQCIFENLKANTNTTATGGIHDKGDSIKFSPSFTPAHTYFQTILLHRSRTETTKAQINIPKYMHIHHSHRTLQPYLETKKLCNLFRKHDWHVKPVPLSCTSDRNYVGVFRLNEHSSRGTDTKKPDYNIEDEEWLENLKRRGMKHDINDELEFKTNLDRYEKRYRRKLDAEALKRKKFSQGSQHPVPTFNEVAKEHTLDTMSINVFTENNMDPIQNINLDEPRRYLEKFSFFDDLSDQELNYDDLPNENDNLSSTSDNDTKSITFYTSNFDCWLLLGNLYHLKEVHKKILENKFPRSFFWLLETCAQAIGVDWYIVYEQVLIIELMFAYGIENLNEFQGYIHYKYNNPIKDLNLLINSHRDIW